MNIYREMVNMPGDVGVSTLTARTASGIADEIAGRVRTGGLAAGDRLPTIRSVAATLGVSVGTVAEAWGSLRALGLIETRRRGGTIVLGPGRAASFRGWDGVDFLLSAPDPALQPPLEAAILAGLNAPGVNDWGREPMVDALRRAVAAEWPFPGQAWISAGGGTEALWLATRAALQEGRPVAVEEPAPPGYLATLAGMGAAVIGVPVDDDGPVPEAVAHAVAAGAGTFVHQPGGPFSDRSVLGAARRDELAGVLGETDVLVVEDDSLGPLSAVPVRSLGTSRPEHTIRVLSYCKAYGLDLRTSVIGGSRRLVDRAAAARSGGIASNSRILQNALAWMLGDAAADGTVADARVRYARRRDLALAAFARAGLTARSGPGSLVVWVEVPDERAAATALATRGIVVEGSSSAFVTRQRPELVRLSIAQLPEDAARVDDLADTVVRAVAGDLRIGFA